MLSRIFLIKQKKCCGNGCLLCPYHKKHSRGSRQLRKEVVTNLEDWEKEQLTSDKSYSTDK